MCVDMRRYLREDVVDRSLAVNAVVFSGAGIEIFQRTGCGVVDVETVVYGLRIVVAAATFFSTLDKPLTQLVVVDLQTYYPVELGSPAAQHLVESLSLGYGTRKSVENHTFAGCRMVELVREDVDHQVVGDQTAVGDIAVGQTSSSVPLAISLLRSSPVDIW